MTSTLHWNAIYTRANCELKVCRILEKKGIGYYYPQNKLLVNSVHQKRNLMTALFPSIVFVEANENLPLLSLVKLSNVRNLVYWKYRPAVFPAEEINLLRNFMEAHECVDAIKTDLGAKELLVKEPINQACNSTDKTYTLHLPSIGYLLSAKTEPVTKIRLVRKNTSGHRVADSLAFILGFKITSD
jgi:transcription termination/antitermination protein NusG